MFRTFLKVTIASGLAGLWGGMAWSEMDAGASNKGAKRTEPTIERIVIDPALLPIPGFGVPARTLVPDSDE